MSQKTNLNTLAQELTVAEGLGQSLSIGQVKEVLALLGIRWRNMPMEDAMAEISCLMERGGKLSEHKLVENQ